MFVQGAIGDSRLWRQIAIRSIDVADTLHAGAALADFDQPALIVWGRDDECFAA